MTNYRDRNTGRGTWAAGANRRWRRHSAACSAWRPTVSDLPQPTTVGEKQESRMTDEELHRIGQENAVGETASMADLTRSLTMPENRTIVWFSCGVTSAVAAKLALATWPNALIVRIRIASEHTDSDRFSDDVARWLGRDVVP